MRQLEIKPENLEKVELNKLVSEISSKVNPSETTSLIQEMRNRNYG